MNNLVDSQKFDFILNNLDHCSKFIDNINKQIDAILTDLSSNKNLYSSFSVLSDSLDIFFDLSSKLVSSVTPNIKKNTDKSLILEIKQLNIQHLSIIRSLMYCYKAKDLIAFADLLEYELKDGLTQWKINFIPRLKSQLI